MTAGTPGMAFDGSLPADITAQAEQAWQHILKTLERAGMGVGDQVKITSTCCTRTTFRPTHRYGRDFSATRGRLRC